jgi:hypothetical protein
MKFITIIFLLFNGVTGMNAQPAFIKPIVLTFSKEPSNAFPVIEKNAFGIESDEQVMIVTLNDKKLKYAKFPKAVFEGGMTNFLPQKNPDWLFVHQNRGICVLDLKGKKASYYIPKSAYKSTYFTDVKVIDYEKSIVLTLLLYFVSAQDLSPRYSFTLDDIVHEKQLKELHLQRVYLCFCKFFLS